MGRRATSFTLALVVVATLSMGLAGCQNARIGARCHTSDFGQTSTQILQCKSGRWRVLMTKAQYVQLLIQLKQHSTTTIAPVPISAPAPTTPTTTAPPATTTTTTPPPALPYALGPGYEHSCAVVAGTVKCIGRNQYGQLGNGTTTDSTTAWVSPGLTHATSVSSSSGVSCALKDDGTVWCWGFGGGYELGNSQFANSPIPVQVAGITTATQISVGPNAACARLADATVTCWGTGPVGTDPPGFAGAPVAAYINNVASVAVGIDHACAVKTDTSVWCWGRNDHGQLGNGSTTDSAWPVQAFGVTAATTVAAGGYDGTTCVTRSHDYVLCWGSDRDGFLGDGPDLTSDQGTAVAVTGVSDAVQITMGFRAVCARRATGAVSCWGQGGYLGNGTATPATSPAPVSGLSAAVDLSAGPNATCAKFSDNSAVCWGSNSYGQLGNGSTDQSLYPVTVAGMP